MIKRLHISTTKRNFIAGGPLSSNILNDTIDELTSDLSTLAKQWNSSLVPLLSTVPTGDLDGNIDAYKYGLDGRNLYLDSTASAESSGNIRYFNTLRGRPFTLKEQIDSIYSVLDQLQVIIPDIIDTQGVLSINLNDGNGPLTGAISIPQPVTSIRADGDNPELVQDVILASGGSVTISQSGQTITISSTSPDDADVVHNSGDESVSGTKTFTNLLKLTSSLALNQTVISVLGPTSLDNDHCTVLLDTSSNDVSITLLPAASTLPGQLLLIKKMAAANTAKIIISGGDTVDGNSDEVDLASQYAFVILVSDGISKWNIFSGAIVELG